MSGWAYDDAVHKGHRRVHCAHADLCAAEAGTLLADDEGIRQIALKDRIARKLVAGNWGRSQFLVSHLLLLSLPVIL